MLDVILLTVVLTSAVICLLSNLVYFINQKINRMKLSNESAKKLDSQLRFIGFLTGISMYFLLTVNALYVVLVVLDNIQITIVR